MQFRNIASDMSKKVILKLVKIIIFYLFIQKQKTNFFCLYTIFALAHQSKNLYSADVIFT